MTNPIDPVAAQALTQGAEHLPPTTPDVAVAAAPIPAPTGLVGSGKALAKRAAGAMLDRVGTRAAAVLGGDVASLRREITRLEDELARTRRELAAELTLVRAELNGPDRGTQER